MTDTEKASPADAGCWIDGHWGQYAIGRLVEIAFDHGWNDDKATEGPFQTQYRPTSDLVAQHMASIGPSDVEGLTSDEFEQLTWAADDAEAWLNDHVAPEGYYFEWVDGEFFLSAVEEGED